MHSKLFKFTFPTDVFEFIFRTKYSHDQNVVKTNKSLFNCKYEEEKMGFFFFFNDPIVKMHLHENIHLKYRQ